jgi:CubicO group peptidase (beta-lactamase class C family)
MPRSLAAALLATALAAPPVTTSTPADPRLAPVRAELLRRVAAGELPSVAVAVLQDGRVLWEEALGWADRAAGVPATPRTPYGIASVGKSVTATAVVALAERGLLDLDRPADAYLGPEAPAVHAGERDAVTLRRLLQMTAAVPHGNLSFNSEEAARELTSAALVRDRLFVAFPAGETYLYSNFSYAVLERVLERASGLSYPDLLRREVFAPLGMDDSLVAGWTASGTPPAARYRADGSAIGPAFSLPRSSLAVHASARDLLRYARLSLDALEPSQRRPVSPAGVAAMQRERAALPHALMALGWGSVELGDGWLWLLSNGRAGGAQATVSILPHARLAVVCLTNVTGNAMDALAVEITERLVPGMAAKVERAMTEYEAAVNRPYAPSPELAGAWEGTVHGAGDPAPLRLTFQPDGDVHVALDDQLPTLLAGARWEEGLLQGSFLGTLRLAEPAEHPHRIALALRPAGDSLTGFATASFTTARGHFELPAYVALRRAAAAAPAP